jgi:SAM-dependent methyltransferase
VNATPGSDTDDDALFVRELALSFGAAATVYDQARPGYPAGLFRHIADQMPGPRVLEVGAGTGKATSGLIRAGLEVMCIEPDAAMAAVLAQRTAPAARARIEVTTFEDYADPGTYDGLISAQAWHWTDPATRMDRAAALLRPGGFLGLIWNAGVFREPEVFAAIARIYDDFELSGRQRPAEPVGTAAGLAAIQDPRTWPGDEIAAHRGFEYLGTSLFPWEQDYRAAEFGAFLDSTSWFRVLDPGVRDRLLATIIQTIDDQFRGLITIDWSAQCYSARRRQPG